MNLLSDYIKEYVAFTKDECDMIINFYKQNSNLSFSSETYPFDDGRASNQLTVPVDHSIDHLISNKLHKYFDQYLYDMNKMFDNEWKKNPNKDVPESSLQNFLYESEPYSIVKYENEKGFYDWHHDRLDDDKYTLQRVFSCLIYLNDDFKEGETDFYWYKVVPETGKIVFFPSDHHWIHKGRMPKDGNKYIITTWLQQAIN